MIYKQKKSARPSWTVRISVLTAAAFFWFFLAQSDLYASKAKPPRAPAAAEVSDHQKELSTYKEALLRWPQASSCADFRTLASQPTFRLKEFAKLRSIVACPDFKEAVDFVDFAQPQFEPLKMEAEINLAEKQELWDQYLELLYGSISTYKTENEQVRIIEKGLALAKKKKLKTLITKYEDALDRVAPRKRKKIKAEDFYAVGMNHISAREFDKGRVFLKKVYNDSKRPIEKRRQAFASYRNSYKIAQDKAAHIRAARQYYQWLLKNKEWKPAFEAGTLLARALWTEGKKSQGEKVLNELEQKLSKRTNTFEVHFLRGRMAAEDGENEKAILHFEKAITNAPPKAPLAFKAQYDKAWSLLRMDKWTEAATEFGKAHAMAVEQPDQVRSRYWQAKTLRKAGQKDESDKLFQEIMVEDPLGFYGLLSYRDMDVPIPALALRTPSNLSKESDTLEGKYLTPEILQMIADLSFVGEKKALESFLNDLSLKGPWDWESNEGLELLRSYAKAGLYLPLFSILTKMPKDRREELLLGHPEILFPLDYSDLVTTFAEREKLAPELVLAIIRQESAFDTFARSPADALGLMQIMPSAARKIGKSLDLSVEHHDDLYSPKINIPIGTHLLRQGMDRYKDNLILAIASYNANDRAIKKWLKMRYREDPLEFVEEIPYEETRTYVKLVLRNYVFYKRLKDPSQSMAFPSECLTSLQNFKTSTDKDVVSR